MDEIARAKFIKIKERVDAIRKRYEDQPSDGKIRGLVYGNSGTGKTRLALTCPKPILADSWDPRGFELRSLQPLIKKGELIVDSSFEQDDWKSPRAYREWERTILERRNSGMFDYIGTYILDGTSRWAQSMMFSIMQKGKRVGETPQIQDYFVQQFTGADELGRLLNLPCHVIVTGLIQLDKDEVTGRMVSGLSLWGKFAAQLPPLFSECYVSMYVKEGFKLLTQPEGLYVAKTRMGEGVFSQYESPDIKALLKKAGYDDSDSPYLNDFLMKGATTVG